MNEFNEWSISVCVICVCVIDFFTWFDVCVSCVYYFIIHFHYHYSAPQRCGWNYRWWIKDKWHLGLLQCTFVCTCRNNTFLLFPQGKQPKSFVTDNFYIVTYDCLTQCRLAERLCECVACLHTSYRVQHHHTPNNWPMRQNYKIYPIDMASGCVKYN